MDLRSAARTGVWVLAIAAITGCGGNSGPTAPTNVECSVTLKGKVAGTLSCASFNGTYNRSSNTVQVDAGNVSGTVTVNGVSTTATLTTDLVYAGDLAVKTYAASDSLARPDVIVQLADQATWEAYRGNGFNVGTSKLIITNVGTASATSSGTTYSSIHGTLTAIMPAAGNGATGVDTLTATF